MAYNLVKRSRLCCFNGLHNEGTELRQRLGPLHRIDTRRTMLDERWLLLHRWKHSHK